MSEYVTLAQALTELPDTAKGIATLLASEGIHGDHTCSACPLAVWLFRRTGRDVLVGATSCAIDNADGWGASHKLPPGAVQFVAGFDAVRYPELEYS